MKSKFFNVGKHSPKVVFFFLWLKMSFIIPPKFFLKVAYRLCMGYWMDFEHPVTFTEKLQWLKLYNRKPIYSTIVDKYEAKKYVADIIGEEYIIPTLGVWDNVDDIHFDLLPNQFVLKCTHDSGGLIICKDKKQLDVMAAKKKLKKCLSNNFYNISKEWPYKNVIPRIIAEPYLEDYQYHELRDYKFFCFDGEAKAMFIATGRQKQKEPYFDFFDMEGNYLDIKNGHPNAPVHPELPHSFGKMKELACRLSKDIPHVRVDFYEVNNRILFGEMTFFHHTGMVPFVPNKWNEIFGNWITLPQKL